MKDLEQRSPVNSGSSEAVKAYYSTWWENPKDIRNSVFRRLNQRLNERISSIGGQTALDLGSGRGAIIKILRNQGFAVTAVEFSETFAEHLRATFDGVEVLCEDVRQWSPTKTYDLVTCIELAQVLSHQELIALLTKLRPYTKHLLVSISNADSFHGIWVRLWRLKAPFIVNYTPDILLRILKESGYRILSDEGVGILTPVSLRDNFRLVVVTERISSLFAGLDPIFPRMCHLYLVDAVPEQSTSVAP